MASKATDNPEASSSSLSTLSALAGRSFPSDSPERINRLQHHRLWPRHLSGSGSINYHRRLQSRIDLPSRHCSRRRFIKTQLRAYGKTERLMVAPEEFKIRLHDAAQLRRIKERFFRFRYRQTGRDGDPDTVVDVVDDAFGFRGREVGEGEGVGETDAIYVCNGVGG